MRAAQHRAFGAGSPLVPLEVAVVAKPGAGPEAVPEEGPEEGREVGPLLFSASTAVTATVS